MESTIMGFIGVILGLGKYAVVRAAQMARGGSPW